MAEGEEVVVVTRNTPTTYYFEGDRASGFEHGLIRASVSYTHLTLPTTLSV